jgi:hypothetical protein
MLSVLLMGITLGRSGSPAAVPTPGSSSSSGFRLPLELVMHAAAREGTMPSEMSFPASTSTSSAGIAGSGPLAWCAIWLKAKVWAVPGLALLLIVVAVAWPPRPRCTPY